MVLDGQSLAYWDRTQRAGLEHVEANPKVVSELVRKALGEHVFNAFIQNKKIEWDQYRTQVTEYEIKRYLPIL